MQKTDGQALLDNFLAIAADDAFFRVSLNGCRLWLQTETIKTMTHCAMWNGGILSLNVEVPHFNWIRERLTPNSLFIDVGAAAGTMTLPLSQMNGVEIIAYEPSPRNRGLLLDALERNRIKGVSVRPFAVSDQSGEFNFREFAPDPTGETPWQTETSSLAYTGISDAPHRNCRVSVTTLDGDLLRRASSGSNIVFKIDVEGFEVNVLRGAPHLIEQWRPFFSIDIHKDPFGTGTTEAGVRFQLPDYSFENLGHVLLCSPA